MKRIITLAVAGALALAPLAPAMASAGQQHHRAADQFCYANSNGVAQQCARISNNNDVIGDAINNGTPIDGTAENGFYVHLSGTYDGHPLFQWEFSSGNCLGFTATSGKAIVANCSTGYATIFAFGSMYDINRAYSEALGFQDVLTGAGNGEAVTLTDRGEGSDQIWSTFSS